MATSASADIDELAELSTPLRGWVDVLDTLLMLRERRPRIFRAGLSPHGLATRSRELQLDVSEIYAGRPLIRARELNRLFSAEELAIVADDMPYLESKAVEARFCGGVLGLRSLGLLDLYALLSRRGVMLPPTSGQPLASMSGCCWLARILAAEGRVRVAEDDWFETSIALPALRGAMRGGVRDEEGGPDHELLLRCQKWDIGCRSRQVDSGIGTITVTEACGFDAYRLTGVTFPGSDVPRYREMLRASYDSVIGGDAEPGPSVEPVRVVRRGGRKIAIQETA